MPKQLTHPEFDVQVPASSKLAIADLECDCHLVVLVQLFVETFAHVGLHLDVMGGGQGEERARCYEETERREQHACEWCGAALDLSRG
jgi:hypothetical protein